MPIICNDVTNEGLNFTISTLTHVSILFLILSLFFMMYVSKMITNSINRSLEKFVEKNFTKALNNLNQEDKDNLKIALEKAPLDSFSKLFSQPDKTVEVYNDWLFKMMIVINIFLFLIVFSFIASAYISDNKCVPVKEILLENLSIFVFVGAIEFLFFEFVAIKYVAVPPSLVIKTLISGIKQEL